MQEQMLRLAPNGCVDAINGRVENGECPDYSVLSNWVPAPDTPKQWVPRPAASVLAQPGVGAIRTVVIPTGTTWTVPADMGATNTVYCIGAGGNGSNGAIFVAGGGGAACAFTANVSLTPLAVVNIQIGTPGGTTGSGTAPTANTWFGSSSLVAAGGATPTTNTGAAGGSTANSAGGTKYAGGAGGTYVSGSWAAGGGGAAGSSGAGAAGGNGGTEGAAAGGQGDNGTGGAGGAGTAGVGGAGASGSEIAGAAGAGGGGGGGHGSSGSVGGSGGMYGGGGGGGVSVSVAASGGAGVIIVKYASTAATNITCQTVVGNYVVGMENDPAGSGYDVPFVFNLLSSTFLTVNGVSIGTNTPVSPSAGDWQPPHAEPVGTYVLFSHTGYSGTGSNFYGAINLGAGTAGAVQVVLNAGSSWTAPANWNSGNNTVQCIGAGANGGGGYGGGGGANGGNGNASQGGDGGAGGAGGGGGQGGHGAGWAQYTNLTLTPGNSYSYSIGTAGGPTWFDTSTTVQAVGGSSGAAYGTTTAAGAAGSYGGYGSAGAGGSAHYYGTGGQGGNGGTGGAGGAGGAAAGPSGFAGTGGAGGGASGGGGGGYGAGSGQNGGYGSTGYGNYGSAASGYGAGGGGGCGGPGGGGGGGGGEKSSGSLGGGGGGSSPGGGGAGGQGVIIITYYPTIAALTYTAQNTLTNPLPSVPVWITQFNGRAYFALNPGGTTPPSVMCSDVLGVASGPLSRSAAVAGVILTFGDLTPLVGMGCLSLTNLTTGGVTQALYVFKSAQQGSPDVFQITGDVGGQSGSGTSNLSLQKLNADVSTTAPNSVISTPIGLFFSAPDGLRYIDLQGHMQPPIGYGGSGKPSPFVNASPQSRIAGAYNASTLCFGMFNNATQNTETWVYDITRQCWHGPHTFPVGLINSLGNSFLVSPYISSTNYGLYNFSLVPTPTSSYTELGASMQCVATSALVPDRNDMSELSCVRALAYFGVPAGGNLYNVSMQDVNGNVLGTSAIYTGYTESAATFLAPFDITWPNPIVFNMASVSVSTTAAAGVRLGSFQLPVSQSGFTSRAPGN